jgi:hypothetical protein
MLETCNKSLSQCWRAFPLCQLEKFMLVLEQKSVQENFLVPSHLHASCPTWGQVQRSNTDPSLNQNLHRVRICKEHLHLSVNELKIFTLPMGILTETLCLGMEKPKRRGSQWPAIGYCEQEAQQWLISTCGINKNYWDP